MLDSTDNSWKLNFLSQIQCLASIDLLCFSTLTFLDFYPIISSSEFSQHRYFLICMCFNTLCFFWTLENIFAPEQLSQCLLFWCNSHQQKCPLTLVFMTLSCSKQDGLQDNEKYSVQNQLALVYEICCLGLISFWHMMSYDKSIFC